MASANSSRYKALLRLKSFRMAVHRMLAAISQQGTTKAKQSSYLREKRDVIIDTVKAFSAKALAFVPSAILMSTIAAAQTRERWMRDCQLAANKSPDSGDTFDGKAHVEAMLLKAGIEASSIVPAANLIELLDHVPVHRSIGLMRSSAGLIRRDDVLYKPLADSVQLETAIAWRALNRNSQFAVLPGCADCVRSTIIKGLAGMRCNIREDCPS